MCRRQLTISPFSSRASSRTLTPSIATSLRSSILPVLAYQEAFKFSQIGYGSAIATVTLVIGALFSIVYARVLRPEVE